MPNLSDHLNKYVILSINPQFIKENPAFFNIQIPSQTTMLFMTKLIDFDEHGIYVESVSFKLPSKSDPSLFDEQNIWFLIPWKELKTVGLSQKAEGFTGEDRPRELISFKRE